MSNSNDAKTQNSGTANATVASPLEQGVLNLDSFEGHEGKFGIRTVSLHGLAPPEEPFRHRLAQMGMDHREIFPLTLQFKSTAASSIVQNKKLQDRIRAGVWTTLSELLSKANCTLPNDLPVITFNECVDSGGDHCALINVAFSTLKAFSCAREGLKEIRFGGGDGEQRVYIRRQSSNTLPRDIFSIDCLELPIEAIDIETLFSSLRSLFAQLGSLVGIAQVVVTSNKWHLRSSSGVLRSYIKLDRRWMSVPLKELALRLPSHLKWYGSVYRLSYVGVQHHIEPTHSLDYPLQGEAASQASETPSTANSSHTNGNGHQSTEASKKRKTTEQ